VWTSSISGEALAVGLAKLESGSLVTIFGLADGPSRGLPSPSRLVTLRRSRLSLEIVLASPTTGKESWSGWVYPPHMSPHQAARDRILTPPRWTTAVDSCQRRRHHVNLMSKLRFERANVRHQRHHVHAFAWQCGHYLLHRPRFSPRLGRCTTGHVLSLTFTSMVHPSPGHNAPHALHSMAAWLLPTWRMLTAY